MFLDIMLPSWMFCHQENTHNHSCGTFYCDLYKQRKSLNVDGQLIFAKTLSAINLIARHKND